VKILVINTGSSSIKFKMFDMDNNIVLISGIVEKIGENNSSLTYKINTIDGKHLEFTKNKRVTDHKSGIILMSKLFIDKKYGVIDDTSQITAVGHRVVHGGETFHTPVVIDEQTIAAIKENIPLAPLHNPPNLTGIELSRKIFPGAVQVAVFDTAFHQSMPEEAYIYALPYELYEKHRVRKYGFHGTSHLYVAQKAADYLKKPFKSLKMITIHLGNGASMTAIANSLSIDTTMGMTPLDGLVMGTRCGDIDPALHFFFANHLNMKLDEIDRMLNKESGLTGICGSNDMREVIKKKEKGNLRAQLALKIYTRRIKKYIGAFFAELEAVDCIVFTGGIGENSPQIREAGCSGLGRLGIELDVQKNRESYSSIHEINTTESEVKILVIPTDEELMIAKAVVSVSKKRQPCLK